MKKPRRKFHKRFIPLYLMILPGALYLLINNYLPMIGMQIAFKQYNFSQGIFGSRFIGLKNFEFLFKSHDSWLITRNTLGYNALFIVLDTVLAITVSIMLSEIRKASMKKTYQTFILIPFLISMPVISYLVYAFLAADTGFINMGILKPLGKDPVTWYVTPKHWPTILTIVHEWKYLGYNTIVYYATIVGINKEYYESAAIDGAGAWKQITRITLPLLRPTIIILVLMQVGRIFHSDFGLFYQVPMNSGQLINVTNTIDTYVYRGLMQLNNISMSSAAGVYQSLVGFVLVLSANLIVRKISPDEALF